MWLELDLFSNHVHVLFFFFIIFFKELVDSPTFLVKKNIFKALVTDRH